MRMDETVKKPDPFQDINNIANDDDEEEEEEDEEDNETDNGIAFSVNKHGFPIIDDTWEKMWDNVVALHPHGYAILDRIRDNANLPNVYLPQVPVNLPLGMPVSERMELIQNYMSSLRYNHTGMQFFEIKKSRPISGLMEVAKDMIKESLPIKCLEAVILGLHLTNGMTSLERYPISFKTIFNKMAHYHVVLGLYHAGSYGALGMSRRNDLMYKALVFKSLSDLVTDYEDSYTKYGHELRNVKIGLPVPHEPHSYEPVIWKAFIIKRAKVSRKEMCKELDKYSREIRPRGKAWLGASPQKSSTTASKDTASNTEVREKISSPYKKSPNKSKQNSHRKVSCDQTYQVRV